MAPVLIDLTSSMSTAAATATTTSCASRMAPVLIQLTALIQLQFPSHRARAQQHQQPSAMFHEWRQLQLTSIIPKQKFPDVFKIIF
jgi:hypothetical protein